MPTRGSYLEVDMNEETMVMDDIESRSATSIMDAKKAVQKMVLLYYTNGNLHSEQSEIYRLASRMVGPRFHNMMVDESAKALFLAIRPVIILELILGSFISMQEKTMMLSKLKILNFIEKINIYSIGRV